MQVGRQEIRYRLYDVRAHWSSNKQRFLGTNGSFISSSKVHIIILYIIHVTIIVNFTRRVVYDATDGSTKHNTRWPTNITIRNTRFFFCYNTRYRIVENPTRSANNHNHKNKIIIICFTGSLRPGLWYY